MIPAQVSSVILNLWKTQKISGIMFKALKIIKCECLSFVWHIIINTNKSAVKKEKARRLLIILSHVDRITTISASQIGFIFYIS